MWYDAYLTLNGQEFESLQGQFGSIEGARSKISTGSRDVFSLVSEIQVMMDVASATVRVTMYLGCNHDITGSPI